MPLASRCLVPVLAAIGACGVAGGADRPLAVTPATSSPGDVAPRPPLARPGELMTYELSLHGVELAAVMIAVGEPVELGGRDVLVIQGGVEASALVALVHDVHDSFTAWIDARTSAPVLFRAVERASADDAVTEEIDSAPGDLAGTSFPVHVRRPDQPPQVVQQTVGEAPVFDLLGFLMELRAWDGPAGSVRTADVIRSRFVWRARLEIVGRETVPTPYGDLPALRFDGRSQRVSRDGTLDPTSDVRACSIWISDDADRVPLLIVGRTDYGDIRMELVDYRAE